MTMMNSILIVAGLMMLGTPGVLVIQEPAKPAASDAAVKVPDTPAGRGLKEFVESFNAGGDKRKAWVESRTTVDKENAADILGLDAKLLGEHGKVTVVRVPKASDTNIEAILRHETSGAHGYLTLEVEAAAPYKITNMQLRPASPEEIKGL